MFPSNQAWSRNIVATFLDKGTCRKQDRMDIAAELQYVLANSLDDDVFQTDCNSSTTKFVRNPTKALFKGIISEMKSRGAWKHIKSFTLLSREKNFALAKDAYHTNCFLDETFRYTDDHNTSMSFHSFAVLKSKDEEMFLKSDEERKSLIKCNSPCLNGGQCNHHPYSSNLFCDCKHFTHGARCETLSNITTASNLEILFQQTVTIPNLQYLHFDVKNLSGYIGSSMGNIESAVDHFEKALDKEFVQLRMNFQKLSGWKGIPTEYGELVKNLQKLIELLSSGKYSDGSDVNTKGLHDLAEAVLGAQRYHGIRKWLHDMNQLINGTTGISSTRQEPFIISFMEQFKNNSCPAENKKAIDNLWRQLMVLQLRGYMVWFRALKILNENTDSVVRQYIDYTTSQTDTLKSKTCSITIPGSENVNCSGAFYLSKNTRLKVVCKHNYYLLGNAYIGCGNVNSACKFCNCNLQGSVSQQCDDQTGTCHCRGTNYGSRCENRDCTWSSWGSWSNCPCGYENQTRSRRILETAMGSATCHGVSLESRTCFQTCCRGQFHCSTSHKCIPESKHCDSRQDCIHNEDESSCCETKYTTWRENGGGNTIYIDKHHLDCGSQTKMISEFALEASPSPANYIRYKYTCCQISASYCHPRWKNNAATEEQFSLIYLDKQHVDCGTNSVMNAFRLIRNHHGQWYYSYKCCDFYWTTHHVCTTNYAPWSTEGSGKNFYLDRQDVRCDRGYLSYFHLERNTAHTSIRYNYRCCSVQ